MSNYDYTQSESWKWDDESGGQWASVNRAIAGPTHEKTLPVVEKQMQLYFKWL